MIKVKRLRIDNIMGEKVNVLYFLKVRSLFDVQYQKEPKFYNLKSFVNLFD